MAYVSTREVISGFQGDFKLLCEKSGLLSEACTRKSDCRVVFVASSLR